MSYKVKEVFYTLQGEGAHAGRPAIFCRFTGCNLWSGHEKDRLAAVCQFCDTDFVGTDGPGGGRFETPEALAGHIAAIDVHDARFVVCTGGEPLLQLDAPLIDALHDRRYVIAIESNGTIQAPSGIDWICISPKAGADLVQRTGHELKLVYPQPGAEPPLYETLDFANFFLQPMDGPDRSRNTDLAIEYCLAHPRWRLSLQTHKLLGLP